MIFIRSTQNHSLL